MGKDKKEPIRTFVENDEGYLRWTRQNPTGFVLNCHKIPDADYLILHSADCGTITTTKRTHWTTSGYIKLCSLSKVALKNWAKKAVGGELHPCGQCKP